MKSKDDLVAQIQRIYKRFKNHRLYDLAQHLVLLYNHRMSMTDTNLSLHKRYMECKRWGKEDDAQRYLDEMGTHKYPREVYVN